MECEATRCHKEATHRLTFTNVKYDIKDVSVEYCLEDALYFFAWLQYVYPGEYSDLVITPPASELFPDRN